MHQPVYPPEVMAAMMAQLQQKYPDIIKDLEAVRPPANGPASNFLDQSTPSVPRPLPPNDTDGNVPMGDTVTPSDGVSQSDEDADQEQEPEVGKPQRPQHINPDLSIGIIKSR